MDPINWIIAFLTVKVQPLGVAGQIIPWNFPLPVAHGRCPAIATSNTVVFETRGKHPLTLALKLAGDHTGSRSAGVVNIIIPERAPWCRPG